MLQWLTIGGGVRFGLIVRHTGEYAYDRRTPLVRLDKVLDAVHNWTVVDMRQDWNGVRFVTFVDSAASLMRRTTPTTR